jgi:hypothetical protein
MGNKKIEDRNKLNASLEQKIIPGTGITVSDSSADGVVHRTIFTVPSTTQDVVSAALAFGKLLGTLPKVNFFVHAAHVDLSNAFVGIQPRLRQTPPSSAFSTQIAFSPS